MLYNFQLTIYITSQKKTSKLLQKKTYKKDKKIKFI